jgi:hypothetical protein
VPCGEAAEKVENLFLPTRNRHAAIVANKKRTARKTLQGTFKVKLGAA